MVERSTHGERLFTAYTCYVDYLNSGDREALLQTAPVFERFRGNFDSQDEVIGFLEAQLDSRQEQEQLRGNIGVVHALTRKAREDREDLEQYYAPPDTTPQ